MSSTSAQLPTAPTPDDLAERDKFRHNLKLALILLCLATVVILGLGIYVATDPGQYNYGFMVFGYALVALAIACLIASVVTGNLLIHSIRAISETKVYLPKDANALRDKPYPRQSQDTVRRRRVPARTQPRTNREEQGRDASANGNAPITERVAEPPPLPSAPPPAVRVDNINRNTAEDGECEKVLPPAPDLERPPPFAPPPDFPPPPYEEISWPASTDGDLSRI
ncbi:unnamed protein product [Taenia asiatica]|uniref:IncA protein n=1 Tax=Taenia asiatica TaxID=60517 RepID=A0A0R3W8C6_TAEAS|nr:unnamed protein product [Taenia asiatica]